MRCRISRERKFPSTRYRTSNHQVNCQIRITPSAPEVQYVGRSTGTIRMDTLQVQNVWLDLNQAYGYAESNRHMCT